MKQTAINKTGPALGTSAMVALARVAGGRAATSPAPELKAADMKMKSLAENRNCKSSHRGQFPWIKFLMARAAKNNSLLSVPEAAQI